MIEVITRYYINKNSSTTFLQAKFMFKDLVLKRAEISNESTTGRRISIEVFNDDSAGEAFDYIATFYPSYVWVSEEEFRKWSRHADDIGLRASNA